jgi:hypothetical protein
MQFQNYVSALKLSACSVQVDVDMKKYTRLLTTVVSFVLGVFIGVVFYNQITNLLDNFQQKVPESNTGDELALIGQWREQQFSQSDRQALSNFGWKSMSDSERKQQEFRPKKTQPHLCTWFTTFKNSSIRNTIQMNTVHNWQRFRPEMQPIAFTEGNPDSDDVLRAAADNGWILLPVPATNEYGTPFLKEMVVKMVNLTTTANSLFYGFANGDILFDDSLPATLHAVAASMHHLPPSPILITGRRTNFDFTSNRSIAIRDLFFVEEMRKRGVLFEKDAEDYFFFTRDFPWRFLRRLVIGRPAIDNYIVAAAQMLNVTVIEATKTLTAVHQMAFNEGNNAGSRNPDKDYNKKSVGPFIFVHGYTNAIRYQTLLDEKEMKIRIGDRKTRTLIPL